MFIEINNNYYNARFMSGLSETTEEVDSATKYVVVYSFANGDIIKEYFDTQNEADSKFDEVKDTSAGGGGITPTGTISITSNGNDIDVTNYATANVNVSSSTTLLAELESYLTKYSSAFIPITLNTGQSGYNYYMFSQFQYYLKNNTTKGILIYYPNSTYSNEKYFFVQYYTGSMQPTEIYRLYSLKNHTVATRFKYSQGMWTESNSDY